MTESHDKKTHSLHWCISSEVHVTQLRKLLGLELIYHMKDISNFLLWESFKKPDILVRGPVWDKRHIIYFYLDAKYP